MERVNLWQIMGSALMLWATTQRRLLATPPGRRSGVTPLSLPQTPLRPQRLLLERGRPDEVTPRSGGRTRHTPRALVQRFARRIQNNHPNPLDNPPTSGRRDPAQLLWWSWIPYPRENDATAFIDHAMCGIAHYRRCNRDSAPEHELGLYDGCRCERLGAESPKRWHLADGAQDALEPIDEHATRAGLRTQTFEQVHPGDMKTRWLHLCPVRRQAEDCAT